MYLKHPLRTSIFSFFTMAILVACASVKTMEAPKPEVFDENWLPHKVAILPFVNQTSNPEAAAVVRKMFYNFFSSLNYLDLEPSFVDEKLKKKN